MNKEYIFTIFLRIAILTLFIWWGVFAYQYAPSWIIQFAGEERSYFIAFALAFFGGLSPIISIPYYLVIMSFGAAGLNPYLLGLAGGVGVILGDSVFYFIGYTGKEFFSEGLQEKFKKFSAWCLEKPFALVFFLLFLYGSLIPLPNTFIVISMALMRFTYWRVMIPLAIGNIFFNTGAALIGAYGITLLAG